MKKLGLIGGIGPESTISYYHDIIYSVQEKIGKSYFPNLNIESLSVFEVLKICKDNDYDELVKYLMKGINNLVSGGADFVAMTGNTPHIVFDELVKQCSVPIISIVDTTCEEVQKKGISKLGLLGTEVTMKEDFFKKPFIKQGISVITPTNIEIDFISEKISNELELGIVNNETLSRFLEIINRMIKDEKIEAIILGCTELPLLFKDVTIPIPCFDTMEIHIKKLVNMILEN
jgi:aspartate racemase